MATVTNINGTSEATNTSKCGSWINHWKNYSGQSVPTYCPASGCIEKQLLGAHVQKANSSDRSWYIVPLCQKHNKSNTDITTNEWVNLVPANKTLTCEK